MQIKEKKKNSTLGIKLTNTLDGRTLGIPFDDTKLAGGMYRDDTMNSIAPFSSRGILHSHPTR